jgi:hypothetical protein
MVNMSVPYSIKATYYSCVMLAVAGDIKELERSKREGITRLVVYIRTIPSEKIMLYECLCMYLQDGSSDFADLPLGALVSYRQTFFESAQ